MNPSPADARTPTAGSRVKIAPSVYARTFGSEMVLLDFGRGEYFGLDELGTEIWRHLEAGEALAAIADAIVERHEVARDVALGDIVELVRSMIEHSLVSLE